MKRIILFFIFWACLLSIVYSQTVVRGPYLQKASSSRITIKWRTDIPTQSKIEYGTSLGNFNKSVTDMRLKTEHELEILSLNSGTVYYYQISDADEVLIPFSSDLYFKTHPKIGTKAATKFWVLGDCGTANASQRAVRDAYYNYIGTGHTDGILLLGDNAYNNGTDAEYQKAIFENMYENKLKNSILWSTLGNHDGYSTNSNSQTGPYYDIFSFPTAGESGGVSSGTEAYYSFDYGNIHFICLESYQTDRSIGGTMYNWCKNDIQNTTQDWIVALWHHPPYSKGSHDSDTETGMVEMRQNFLPMLESNGVDLVLSGHSHSYERSYFLNGHYGSSNSFNPDLHTVGANGYGNGKADDATEGNGAYAKDRNGEVANKGAVYITAGNSGKYSGASLNHKAMYYSVAELGSCVVEVKGDQMDVKFIRETGAIDDYFTIKKNTINCTVGGACDDGNPNTRNDVYDIDCTCKGALANAEACDQVNSGADDVEQGGNGNMYITSSDLELVRDGNKGDQIIGIRFNNLIIPKGASISDAYIQFTSDAQNTEETNLVIKGINEDNASPFSSTRYNVSSRSTTNTSVNWSLPEWNARGESGQDQRTPNLSSILNSIVSRSGYVSGNSIGLIITGSGKRVAKSFEGSSFSSPKLCVTYSSTICPTVGRACNDGDPCTVNDIYNAACDCIGTFKDSDYDGVCDANDRCEGAEPGSPCSDGNPCTFDDVLDGDCNCKGVYRDSDNDGVCDGNDQCPGFDNRLIGTACNDGDVCTINDIYQSDCGCVGTYVDSDSDGVCDANDKCPGGPESGTACDDKNVCTDNDRIDNNCNCVGTFKDSDNDGICDVNDKCPNVSNDGSACTPMQTVVRGPYLQKASSNRITIKWKTDKPTQSKIEYGTSLGDLNKSVADVALKTTHELDILGLTPGTVYYYQVSDRDQVLVPASNKLYFKTHPKAGTKTATKFWALGDCGTANNNQKAVRDAYYNYIGTGHTDGILLLGDNAYNRGTDAEYQRAIFENMYEDKLKNTILWSTLGNHDGYSTNSNSQTGPYYDIFSFPTAGESGGIPSGTEAYYSFDYGNIHFICLESYQTDRSIGGTMYNWCKNDIQNTTQDWIVAFWHHPPYTKGSHNSDSETQLIEMRQNFLPMLESNGVDLVLSGHSHSYERSYFLNGHYGPANSFNANLHTVGANGSGNGKMDDTTEGNGAYDKYTNGETGNKGAVYITAGSSGKISNASLNHRAMYYSVARLGSCVVEVDGDQMDVKFIRETGAIDDYFTIKKNTINCTVGAACNDGNPSTQNDVYDVDCACKGSLINEETCDQVDSSSDDVEQDDSGNIYTTSTSIELVSDGSRGDQTIGIRFKDLAIPKGANISNAYIQFTSDAQNTEVTNLVIKGISEDNASSFSSSRYSVSNRPTTSISVNWSLRAWNAEGESGQDQRTPNLSSILNPIVNRSGYALGNSIGLVITGSGKRVAKSFEGSSFSAPKLCVTYSSIICSTLGRACSDGDPCTVNDVFDAACNCIGVFKDSDYDGVCDANDRCNGAEPGSPCSDGDPCTINDVINSNCNCVGIYSDNDNDGVCDGNDECPGFDNRLIGTPCSDGDPCTLNDTYRSSCACIGTYEDKDKDGICDAKDKCPNGPEPGASCNDNDPCTVNDIVDGNCNCVGTPSDKEECNTPILCPGGLNPGAACDDSNPCTNGETYDSNCNCVGGVNLCKGKKVHARIILEGFYDASSGNMNTKLKNNNLIPLTQPYNVSPWFYTGIESVSSLPDGVVDWVLLMVRDANGLVLNQAVGFINQIGDLVEIDGTMGITIEGAIGNYFSIHHRSHLAVLSALRYYGGVYNFTLSESQAQGIKQLKLLAGKYMLYAGDYDGNGIINNIDFNKWRVQSAVLNKYLRTDGDGNGVINNVDYNLWIRNRSKLGHSPIRY